MEMGLTAGEYFYKVEVAGYKEPHPGYLLALGDSENDQLEIESNNTVRFADAFDVDHPKQGRIYSETDIDYFGFYSFHY